MRTLTAELKHLPLFAGMTEEEIARQADALRGFRSREEKGNILIREGEKTERCGILLEGTLQGHRVDEDGVLSVVSTLSAGMMFGEILIFSDQPSPVTLTALTDCRILWLGPIDLQRTDARLIRNLLALIGSEYWALHQKIRYCSIVSLRKRILTFLKDHEATPKDPFSVPFDRNGMAAYLNADRSALSRELSRMRGEGLIDYHKNRFRLL
ncbi:MAG: Crp/Fnr family transcriptional regulator [Clostridia bacterium]|nr:Crp/Fnr family transcriptional regulator [Clostridia bacterium]MBQ4324064.1 Crp/Fnr family transcriptional regulator [Clostridia bacterium]